MTQPSETAMRSAREKFEEAVAKHLGDDRHLARFPEKPDQYDSYLVEHLWWCWQAALDSSGLSELQRELARFKDAGCEWVAERTQLERSIEKLTERAELAEQSSKKLAVLLQEFVSLANFDAGTLPKTTMVAKAETALSSYLAMKNVNMTNS